LYNLIVLLALIGADPLEKELEQAQQEEKFIFLFFTADDCDWCEKMEKETLEDKRWKEFAPKYYITRYIENTELELIKKYKVTKGFPTYLILNNKGKELNRGVGFRPYPSFIKWQNSTWKKKNEKSKSRSQAFHQRPWGNNRRFVFERRTVRLGNYARAMVGF